MKQINALRHIHNVSNGMPPTRETMGALLTAICLPTRKLYIRDAEGEPLALGGDFRFNSGEFIGTPPSNPSDASEAITEIVNTLYTEATLGGSTVPTEFNIYTQPFFPIQLVTDGQGLHVAWYQIESACNLSYRFGKWIKQTINSPVPHVVPTDPEEAYWSKPYFQIRPITGDNPKPIAAVAPAYDGPSTELFDYPESITYTDVVTDTYVGSAFILEVVQTRLRNGKPITDKPRVIHARIIVDSKYPVYTAGGYHEVTVY